MLALKSMLGMIAGMLTVSSGVASASTLISSPARLDSFETVDVAPRVLAYRWPAISVRPANLSMRRLSRWRGLPCSTS